MDQFLILRGVKTKEETLRMIKLMGDHVIPKFDTDPVHRTTRQRGTAGGRRCRDAAAAGRVARDPADEEPGVREVLGAGRGALVRDNPAPWTPEGRKRVQQARERLLSAGSVDESWSADGVLRPIPPLPTVAGSHDINRHPAGEISI